MKTYSILKVRKIGAPGQEEFGMGAIAVINNELQMVLNEATIRSVQPSKEYFYRHLYLLLKYLKCGVKIPKFTFFKIQNML